MFITQDRERLRKVICNMYYITTKASQKYKKVKAESCIQLFLSVHTLQLFP